jgi:hypothetical protein
MNALVQCDNYKIFINTCQYLLIDNMVPIYPDIFCNILYIIAISRI